MIRTFTWVAPTMNTAGGPLDYPLAGFRLYWGSDPGMYTDMLDIPDGMATTYTATTQIPPGMWYFALTAYDTAGQESDFSNEVMKVVQ